MQKTIKAAPLSTGAGILLILKLALILLGASMLLRFIEYTVAYFSGGARISGTTYTIASVSFWIVGGVLACNILRTRIVEYIVTLDAKRIRLERSYGMRPRFMEDVYFSSIKEYGAPEDMTKKYPDARKTKACMKTCATPVTVFMYQSDGAARLLYLQADEELKAAIIKRCGF